MLLSTAINLIKVFICRRCLQKGHGGYIGHHSMYFYDRGFSCISVTHHDLWMGPHSKVLVGDCEAAEPWLIEVHWVVG
jgi:hypothetical protein